MVGAISTNFCTIIHAAAWLLTWQECSHAHAIRQAHYDHVPLQEEQVPKLQRQNIRTMLEFQCWRPLLECLKKCIDIGQCYSILFCSAVFKTKFDLGKNEENMCPPAVSTTRFQRHFGNGWLETRQTRCFHTPFPPPVSKMSLETGDWKRVRQEKKAKRNSQHKIQQSQMEIARQFLFVAESLIRQACKCFFIWFHCFLFIFNRFARIFIDLQWFHAFSWFS